MDYINRYNELLKKNKRLEKELEFYRSTGMGESKIARDMIFKVFHSASCLMAISELDTGRFVDINSTFLTSLGYQEEEIIGRTPDDIQFFGDFVESNKYIKLISKLKKIKDYPLTLKTKSGEDKRCHFSTEKVLLDDKSYLLTIYEEIGNSKDRMIKESQGSVLGEIYETVSSYLTLYSIGDDGRFYIIDLNRKVEEVELVWKSEVLDKCIDDTPLANRVKLVELLHYLRITGNAHKLAASPSGDDSEGYYMGFLLTTGNIVITWEPGKHQKNLYDFNKQGAVFEKFSEMLPEMIYEVDLTGQVLYCNRRGLNFFGYSEENISRGIDIADLFPDSYQNMTEGLKTLKTPIQTSHNEYFARKKDGTQVPVETHSFATFLDNKIIGYRCVVTDISRQKEYEDQIKREKTFLENLIDSTPEAIAIIDTTGKISLINNEFTILFGYTSKEAIDKFINDLIVPDDMKEEALTINKLASQNRKEVRQTIRKDKSGNKIQVSLIATTIIINNKIVAFLSIYRDITTEKKNQLLQEILYNISTAALKQYDIKEICPIIVPELSKIWDMNNFFIALYD
ncbi:MAG: PAS domain S-box protein, partial [Bacteroidota bacterium]